VLVKGLGILVALLTIAGGSVTLLFHLRPGLEPCVGGSSAEFTGAPVFPHMKNRDHLFHTGHSKQDAARQPNVTGAEVRYSYRLNNLKGADLLIISSVVAVDHGEVTGVVPGQDRAIARTVTPNTCTETGGDDLFLFIPEPKKHYRVVLELYRDKSRSDRLALFETSTFNG
jgi:hypothetical protein